MSLIQNRFVRAATLALAGLSLPALSGHDRTELSSDTSGAPTRSKDPDPIKDSDAPFSDPLFSDICVDGTCARLRLPVENVLPLDNPALAKQKAALDNFVFGSTFTQADRARLEKNDDLRGTQEGQEAWINATKFEMTAALEKLFKAVQANDPNVRYSLGPWTPPEERETGRYAKSRDDLAGARFLIQMLINVAPPGRPEDLRMLSLILPWKDRFELIGPSDNFRARWQTHLTRPPGLGFTGLSYKIVRDENGRITDFHPDYYALPQREVNEMAEGLEERTRYKGIPKTIEMPHCVECHGDLSRIKPKEYRALSDYAKEAEQMLGYKDFTNHLSKQYGKDPDKLRIFEKLVKQEVGNPKLWMPGGMRRANQEYWLKNYPEFVERFGGK